MEKLTIATLAALTAGTSIPALAQPASTSHQHGQATIAAQVPQSGPHMSMPRADDHCDCCAMMKEMMQMMRAMHQHGAQPGGMHKMNMMQPPGSPGQDVKPDPAAEHQHELKPPK